MQRASSATKQYNHACELPYVAPANVVDRYVSILKSEEFQQALSEATEIKRNNIAIFREVLGRSSAAKSLNKFN